MQPSPQARIAEFLRSTGRAACLEQAQTLEGQSSAGMLHLRSLDLRAAEIKAIADLLLEDAGLLTSISLSYNRAMGDMGAIALAQNLPNSIAEIGLVDCGIGDPGGQAILQAMPTWPQLRMICVEGNNFSPEMKRKIRHFKKGRAPIMIVV